MAGEEIPLSTVIGNDSQSTSTSKNSLLVEFTDQLLDENSKRLPELRKEIVNKLGIKVLVEASATVATFSMLDRIANAVGIPLETEMVEMSEDFREGLGINSYYSATNTLER